MLTVERTTPGEKLALRLHGYEPRNAGRADASPPRGSSINAASFNIPGAGKGINPQRDEYIPSFPEMPKFRISDGNAPDRLDDKAPAAEEPTNTEDPRAAEKSGRSDGELSDDDLRIVADLQNRDREVRAHEQAHISAGGAHIRGGATYEFEKGPDGKRYAVGGEVGIDSSPVRDNPEATISKMQVVRSAALAPAEPSGQDRAVAAAATRNEANAAAELREKRAAEAQEAADRAMKNTAGNKNDGDNKNGNDTANTRQSRIVNDAISAYTKPIAQTTGGINFAA